MLCEPLCACVHGIREVIVHSKDNLILRGSDRSFRCGHEGYVGTQTILEIDGQAQGNACPGSFLNVAGSQFGKELLELLIGCFYAVQIVAACHLIDVGVDVRKASHTGANLKQPFKRSAIPHESNYSVQ